jgi:hypothetical protein
MDAGINNLIYMELHSGPKVANGKCGKTITVGTIDRGSTVYQYRMKELCIKLVIEASLYYDARSEKRQIRKAVG